MTRTLAIAAFAAALTFAGAARAEETYFHPYIGSDLQRYHITYDNNFDQVLESNLNALNIHAGNRFSKYFGMELGYFRSRSKSKNDLNIDLSAATGTPGDALDGSKLRIQGFTLDGLGYLPLTESGKLEAIGTAGLSWTKAHTELEGTLYGVTGEVSDSDSELGYRAGLGLQFNATDHIGLRGLARYQSAGFDAAGFDITDRAWVYSLGVNYSF